MEVVDDNEVENAQSAIGNTPPATGKHIDDKKIKKKKIYIYIYIYIYINSAA